MVLGWENKKKSVIDFDQSKLYFIELEMKNLEFSGVAKKRNQKQRVRGGFTNKTEECSISIISIIIVIIIYYHLLLFW